LAVELNKFQAQRVQLSECNAAMVRTAFGSGFNLHHEQEAKHSYSLGHSEAPPTQRITRILPQG